MASKLPCCGDWHFDPIEVDIHIPKEGIKLNGCIDHVGLSRLLDVQPTKFWSEHEFTCDEDEAEMCATRKAAFEKIAMAKDTTGLLRNCGEGNVLISAILL